MFTQTNFDPKKEYEVLETIGKGSFGAVYRARRRESGEVVAIKKVDVKGEDVESIIREIEIMKDIKSPFVVRYFGNYFWRNKIWISMELCDEGSALELVQDMGTLPELFIAPISKSVLSGLVYLHEKKVVHRDIKPGNLLLAHDGSIKLADFGISSQLTGDRTRMQTMIGTPYFLAPEVVSQGEGYSAKIDVWALGISCLQMADGKPPYSDINPMRALFLISQNDPPTLAKPDTWSPDFLDFVNRALTKAQAERPTAKDMLSFPFVADPVPHHLVMAKVKEVREGRLKERGATSALVMEGDISSSEDSEEVAAAARARKLKADSISDEQRAEMAQWLRKQQELEKEKRSGRGGRRGDRTEGNEKGRPKTLEEWLVEQEEAAREARRRKRELHRERRSLARRLAEEDGGSANGSKVTSGSSAHSSRKGRSERSERSRKGNYKERSVRGGNVGGSRVSDGEHDQSGHGGADDGEVDDQNCGRCGEPIPANTKHLKVLGRRYHMDHFTCVHCSTSLVGSKFATSKGGRQIACTSCHEQYTRGKSNAERAAAAASDKLVPPSSSSSGHHRSSSTGGSSSARAGSPTVGKAGDGASCASCRKTMTAGSVIKAGDKQWHGDCFVCQVCNKSLISESFREKDGKVYCKRDYTEQFSPHCAGCGERIVEEKFSRALGKAWHREHFKCGYCKKAIYGGYIPSDENDVAYCDADCFAAADS